VTDEQLVILVFQALALAWTLRGGGQPEEGAQQEQRARESLEQLWGQLSQRVRALVERNTRGDPSRADDLFQVSWLCFRQRWPRWDPSQGVSFWNWFQVVLVRAHADWWRQQGREQTTEDLEGVTVARSGQQAAQAEEERTREELRQQHREVIAHLLADSDEQQRRHLRVLLRRYWEDFTLEQLAEEEGVAISTIHNWLRAALGRYEAAYRQLFPQDAALREEEAGS
jgi:RNA polymerase sigma factor (sigma-70 family)